MKPAARRASREIVLQALYLREQGQVSETAALAEVTEHFTASPEREGSEHPEWDREYADKLYSLVSEKKEELDEQIQSHSPNWKLERMARVDLNLLRLSVAEILFLEETPPKVTLNEALEIAKVYGDENSSSFVNGILDSFLAKS